MRAKNLPEKYIPVVQGMYIERSERSEMQKSKVEMVWPCEEEGGGLCWKKTVQHGTT